MLSAGLGIVSLRHQQEAIQDEALDHVERISILLERELSNQIDVLRTLASSPLLDGPVDEAAFAEVARRVRHDQPLWGTVSLSGPDGTRLVDVPEPVTGVPRGKVLEEASHARAIETRHPVIGRILRGPRGRPAFAVRVPAVRGDHVPYVVSAVIEPTAIRDLLFSGNIPAAWAGAVIDGEGRLVARRTGPSSTISEPAAESARAARSRAPGGIYEGANSEGEPLVTAYKVLPTSNWSVHIAIPRESLPRAGEPLLVADGGRRGGKPCARRRLLVAADARDAPGAPPGSRSGRNAAPRSAWAYHRRRRP